jgi:tetratricopeptide (TPR) repeat protein
MSVELTPAESALALQRLLVFKNGFMAEAAAPVCSDDRLSAEKVEAAVTALVTQAALVRSELPTGVVRYDWSGEYVGGGSDAEDLPALELRKAEWFAAYLQDLKPRLVDGNQGLWLDQIQADDGDLHATIEWALEESADPNIPLTLCLACFRYWYVRGHCKIGSELTLTAVNRVPMRQDMNKLRALNNAALMLEARGQFDRAANALKSARTLAQALGDVSAEAAVLGNLATNARSQMDFEKATKFLEEAIALLRSVDDKTKLLPALLKFAATKLDFGEIEGVEELLDEANALAIAAKDDWMGAYVAENRAHLAELRADLETARTQYKDALRCFDTLKDSNGIARQLKALAQISVTASRYEPAATLFGAAELARETCNVEVPPIEAEKAIVAMTNTRRGMGDDAFKRAYGVGHMMRIDEAVRYATANA